MKLKFNFKAYLWIYFVGMVLLFHLEVKHYFYWSNIAYFAGAEFNFSLWRLALATVLFSLNARALNGMNRTKIGFIILTMITALLTVPSLVTFTSSLMYPWNLLGYHQLFFWTLYALFRVRINLDRLPVLNKKQSLYLIFFLITIGIIPYLLIYGPYINLKNLLLIDVYQTRNLMKSMSNPYFGYTYSVFTRILIPLAIVFSLEQKNYLFFVVSLFYLILFYLFGAHKTVYAALIIILVVYKWTYELAAFKLIKFSVVFLAICLILAMVTFDYPWILTFRRTHFLPSLLDIAYVDFFDDNYLIWSESIFKSFVDYPYELDHKRLIGLEYFKNKEVAANNGLISDGFMNFGSLGVCVNVFLISAYFMIINNIKMESRYFGVFLLVVFSFTSSSTFTVFLTHGAFALLLIALFLLRDKEKGLPANLPFNQTKNPT